MFIAGGKWTTWREMAEEVMDRVVGPDGPKCTTLDITLFGGEGCKLHGMAALLLTRLKY
jgi:glycerol-3-phosphate dehydrogenase